MAATSLGSKVFGMFHHTRQMWIVARQISIPHLWKKWVLCAKKKKEEAPNKSKSWAL